MVNQQLRMCGKAYANRRGEMRPAKEPRVMETCNCRFKCNEFVFAERQISLFEYFMKLGDTARQKGFLSSLIAEKDVLRKRPRKFIDEKQKKI